MLYAFLSCIFLRITPMPLLKDILYPNNQTLTTTSQIKATNGEQMPAMVIFTMAMGYLREHLMHQLLPIYKLNERHDVIFVITVPTISNDASRQLMEGAANMVCYYFNLFLMMQVKSVMKKIWQLLVSFNARKEVQSVLLNDLSHM